MDAKELTKRTKFYDLILKNRKNQLKVDQGYDGVDGKLNRG